MEKNTSGIGYSKNIILLIKKGEDTFKGKVSLSTHKNNEIQIEIEGVEDERNNILFDSNIEILILFNFTNINQDILGLILLIYGLKKYGPKSINLILPYFPYTAKDMIGKPKKKDIIQMSTDNGILTLLQNSGISTIKTFDLGNGFFQNYSSIYIENITKDKIFVDEIKLLLRTTKRVSLIVMNQEDHILFKNILGHKENIHIIFIDEDLSLKSKIDQLNILNNISDTNKSIIWIFEKILIRGNRLYSLLNMLGNNLDIKELNLYVTHGIFAQGSYRKFNTIMEKFPFINIFTTNSLFGYVKKLTQDKTTVIKLPLLPPIKTKDT